MKDGDKDSGSAKSAISPGQITITNPAGQQQNVDDLNRDTTNTNDEIKGLPNLQAKLDEQLKTQQEWTQAATNMATGVKELSNKLLKDTGNPIWADGGAGRAALHAIAGGLLGGVNGVDAAIKSAIAAGVSTLIAPYINDIVKEAVAQSGLTGKDAKRMSDTLTSSIVLGLLAGAGGSDAAAYASNEIKYNFLTDEQRFKTIGKDWAILEKEIRECQNSVDAGGCSFEHLQNLSDRMTVLLQSLLDNSMLNSYNLARECISNSSSESCLSGMKYLKDARFDSKFIGLNDIFTSDLLLYYDLVAFQNGDGLSAKQLEDKYSWENLGRQYQSDVNFERFLQIASGVFLGAISGVGGNSGNGKTVSLPLKPTLLPSSALNRILLRNDLARQAGIPRSLNEVWGKTADQISQSFKMDGFKVTNLPVRPRSSGKAEVYSVDGHPEIKTFQVHPGGGNHGEGQYYKFTYKDGTEVRVVDPNSTYNPFFIAPNQRYLDTQGNRITYEGGQWTPWR